MYNPKVIPKTSWKKGIYRAQQHYCSPVSDQIHVQKFGIPFHCGLLYICTYLAFANAISVFGISLLSSAASKQTNHCCHQQRRICGIMCTSDTDT